MFTHFPVWRCVPAAQDSIWHSVVHNLGAMQVDSNGNADSTAGPPGVSEAEVKEAWLASCRAIYEVQPYPRHLLPSCPACILWTALIFPKTGRLMTYTQWQCSGQCVHAQAFALRQKL